MSENSKIEWCDASWNPIRGQNARHTCARISPGCDNCYAATMTRRGLMGTAPIDYGRGETPNDPARLDEAALWQPFKWKKPRKVFVCSMTDLFGSWVPAEWLDRIFAMMAVCRQHTFIVLTKRPQIMAAYLNSTDTPDRIDAVLKGLAADRGWCADELEVWPLQNVWGGTSIESDRFAWRANHVREANLARRWISAEPLLGPLDSLDLTDIDWLVAGGESGPKARPMHPDWARDLRDRCAEQGTSYFFKQWGEFCHPTQLPEDVDGSGSFVDDLLRVGNKKAGRLLDGREWNEFPATPGAASAGGGAR